MLEQSGGYTEEEYEYELQNRMKNLLWTVSGDYELDVELDIQSFRRSKYISLYDAVKQGAFARYFSKDELGLYLVKKLYLGADESALSNLAQMCVDQAVAEKVTGERSGDTQEESFCRYFGERFSQAFQTGQCSRTDEDCHVAGGN